VIKPRKNKKVSELSEKRGGGGNHSEGTGTLSFNKLIPAEGGNTSQGKPERIESLPEIGKNNPVMIARKGTEGSQERKLETLPADRNNKANF